MTVAPDPRISMHDDIASQYRKNPAEEAFLERLNAALAAHEEAGYEEHPDIYPTLHVLGVPRSGTTLLHQLLAAHLDIAYVDHLAAAFWRAPVWGLRLSRKLLGGRRRATYRSDFGRTPDVSEPHEFGYFWSEMLGYEDLWPPPAGADPVDWERVRRVLINMTHAVERPLAFKPLMLMWHASALRKALPKTCYVRVRRDPVDNAMSLLRMRREFVGSEERWASLRPREHAALAGRPVWAQVAGQVFCLARSLTAELAGVDPTGVLDVRYEELCRNPRAVLDDVVALLGRHGAQVSVRSRPPARFEASRPEGAGPDERAGVEAALDACREDPALQGERP